AASARRSLLRGRGLGRGGDAQVEALRLEPRALLLQVGRRQRITLEPRGREGELKQAVAREHFERRQLHGASRPVQQRGQPQQDDELLHRRPPWRGQLLERERIELAPMKPYER